MPDWLTNLRARARVLLTAWPTVAASLTALIGVLTAEVVPQLGGWAPKAAGFLVAAGAFVAAVSAAVARVTPILYPSEKGLLPLPEQPAMEFDPDRLRPERP
jgi:hypothetical protein